jgi:hypothetical protein
MLEIEPDLLTLSGPKTGSRPLRLIILHSSLPDYTITIALILKRTID